MSRDNVVLIGAARSGTKWLRSVIANSSEVKEIPFDVNYVWRTGQHNAPSDRLDPESCDKARGELIRKKLYKLAKVETDQIFLEKTVSNTLRAPFVGQVFPYARYLHLLRDGRDVIESSFRMWNAPQDFKYLFKKLRHFPIDDWRYAVWFIRNTFFKSSGSVPIWGPRYSGIEEDVQQYGTFYACCQQWVNSVETAMSDLAQFKPDQVLTVRYENLVSQVSEIEAVVNFIGINKPDPVLAYYQSSVQSGLGGKWRERLSKDQQQMMLDIAGATLEKLNYI